MVARNEDPKSTLERFQKSLLNSRFDSAHPKDFVEALEIANGVVGFLPHSVLNLFKSYPGHQVPEYFIVPASQKGFGRNSGRGRGPPAK